MSVKSDFFISALAQSGHLSCKYTDLKRRLALSFPNNPQRYAQEESSFIRGVESLKDLAWWSLSDDLEESREMGYLAMLGGKSATCLLLSNYQQSGLPLPTEGTLSCLTDAANNPIAKVENTAIAVQKFGDVSLDFAKKCAIGDRSMESWRQHFREAFGKQGTITDDTEVLCWSFQVVEALDWAYFNPMPVEKFKENTAIERKIPLQNEKSL